MTLWWWPCAQSPNPKICDSWFQIIEEWNTSGLYGRHKALEGTGPAFATYVPMGTHSAAKYNPQARVVEAIWTGCPHSVFHRHIARHTCLQLSRRRRKTPAVHLVVHPQVGVHHCNEVWRQCPKWSPPLASLER
jgi:hypothetical protein